LVRYYPAQSRRFPERRCQFGVLFASRGNAKGIHMWLSLFTLASGAAVGLSVAAVMMQPKGVRTYRG
jgi:hypothetical protein